MNFLEIQFSLRGQTLPADHGYALYSAIKKAIQESDLKDQDNDDDCKNLPQEILLSSIPGIGNQNGIIYLNRASKFRLRCPVEQRQKWYRLLPNQVLDIRGHLIRLVQPRFTLLQSSPILKSRFVTFKLRIDRWHRSETPVYFLESCQKALENLGIKGQVFIESDCNGDLAQKAIKIRQKNILGYSIVVEGLSDEDSLKLQSYGLGGRKHFGCGWFYPIQEESNAA